MPFYKLTMRIDARKVRLYLDQALENFYQFEQDTLDEIEADEVFEASVKDVIQVFVITRDLPLKLSPYNK